MCDAFVTLIRQKEIQSGGVFFFWSEKNKEPNLKDLFSSALAMKDARSLCSICRALGLRQRTRGLHLRGRKKKGEKKREKVHSNKKTKTKKLSLFEKK